MSTPWDQYPPLTAQERLRRHLSRTGADKAADTDPMASLQVAMLRDVLNVVQAALADEEVEPATARRVLDRIMYGCVPHPAEVQARQQISQDFTNYMASDIRPTLIRPGEVPT